MAKKTFLLFGGGNLWCEFAAELKQKGYGTVAFAAPRHLSEQREGGGTVEAYLKKEKVEFYSSEDISADFEKLVKPRIKEGTVGLYLGPAWYLLPQQITAFNGSLLELMGIPLPQYRGGAHYSHQILAGQRDWAVYLQKVGPAKHHGPVLKNVSASFKVKEGALPEDYLRALEKQGHGLLFRKFLPLLESGVPLEWEDLPEEKRSYWPYLHSKTHGWINWQEWDASEIERFIRAFGPPYAGASTLLDGRRIFIKACGLDASEGPFHPFQSGLVYRKGENRAWVAAKGGALIIEGAADEEGKNAIPLIREGVRLHTPREKLEEALRASVDYDAKGLKKQA